MMAAKTGLRAGQNRYPSQVLFEEGTTQRPNVPELGCNSGGGAAGLQHRSEQEAGVRSWKGDTPAHQNIAGSAADNLVTKS